MMQILAFILSVFLALPQLSHAQRSKPVSDSKVVSPTAIRIGVILPLSGTDRIKTAALKDAVEMSSENANLNLDNLKQENLKIEVIVLDSGESPTNLGEVVRRLVRDHGVTALVVGGSRENSIAVQHFSVMYDLPIVFTNLFGEDIPEQNRLLYSTFPSSSGLERGIRKFFEISGELEIVNSFLTSGEPGLSINRAIARVAASNRVKVQTNIWEPSTARDLRVDVIKMQSRPEKQGIFLGASYSIFLGWMKSFGFAPPILASFEVLPLIDSGELPISQLDGSYILTWRISESFAKEYLKRFNLTATPEIAASYDAIQAIASVASINRRKFKEQLVNVDLNGALGKLNFDYRRGRKEAVGELLQVRGGLIEPVR